MTTNQKLRQYKTLNWSKILSGIVGALAPALLLTLNDLSDWLTSQPHLAGLAGLATIATGWIAARGTEAGSLKPKSRLQTEDVEGE